MMREIDRDDLVVQLIGAEDTIVVRVARRSAARCRRCRRPTGRAASRPRRPVSPGLATSGGKPCGADTMCAGREVDGAREVHVAGGIRPGPLGGGRAGRIRELLGAVDAELLGAGAVRGVEDHVVDVIGADERGVERQGHRAVAVLVGAGQELRRADVGGSRCGGDRCGDRRDGREHRRDGGGPSHGDPPLVGGEHARPVTAAEGPLRTKRETGHDLHQRIPPDRSRPLGAERGDAPAGNGGELP